MPIEGYKETLVIDGVEHTPMMIRDKIQSILRTTRISQKKFWEIMDLCRHNQIWLDQHVRHLDKEKPTAGQDKSNPEGEPRDG